MGGKGTQLPEGTAIAQALVQQPGILLLGEAASALDTEREKLPWLCKREWGFASWLVVPWL